MFEEFNYRRAWLSCRDQFAKYDSKTMRVLLEAAFESGYQRGYLEGGVAGINRIMEEGRRLQQEENRAKAQKRRKIKK